MPGSTEVGKKKMWLHPKKKKKSKSHLNNSHWSNLGKKKKVALKLMMSGITGIMISQ